MMLYISIVLMFLGGWMLTEAAKQRSVNDVFKSMLIAVLSIVLGFMLILPDLSTDRKLYCRVDNGVTQMGDCYYK